MQQRAPHHAVVAESVVAIVTRKGNPLNIRGWDDLTRSAPCSLLLVVHSWFTA